MCDIKLHCPILYRQKSLHCNTLQYTVIYCNTLQHTAPAQCCYNVSANHSYMWCNSFIFWTQLIRVWDRTHSCVWHDSHTRLIWLICVRKLVRMGDMTLSYVWHDSFMCDPTHSYMLIHRPTQSVMYVPLQVIRFAESVLLIVQYRYWLKSCSGDFCSPKSDPPHKIMRYWFYYSIWLGFSFPPDRICQVEMI